MQKMSPIPSVPIALHIRAWRIPIRWTVRESFQPEVRDVDGRVLEEGGIERVFWPQVETTKWGDTELEAIEEPLALRNQLFNLLNTNRTEKAALAFLDSVGAWMFHAGEPSQETWAAGTYVNVECGYRYAINLRVLPMAVDQLWEDTKHWYRLLSALRNPIKLRHEYSQPPSADARPIDRALFAGQAWFNNTLQVSLEWHGKDPYAVVDTISAWELMIAAAWADVVSCAEEQVCAKCGTRFTWPRKKKHCRWECGHLAAVRKYKRKRALEKRKERARKSLR